MKKKNWFSLLLLVVFFASVFTGCKKNDDKPDGGLEPVVPTDAEINKKLAEVDAWVKTQIDVNVFADVSLPVEYLENDVKVASISWASSDEKHFSTTGNVTKNRDRKLFVELTYTITYYEKTKVGTINVVIYPRTIYQISQEFLSDIPEFISSDVKFASDFGFGFSVSWQSSDTNVLTNDGKLIKPSKDTPITIEYTVKLVCENGVIMEQKFQKETICGAYSESEKLGLAITWLQNEALGELNFTGDVVLPTKDDLYGVTIKWLSSDSEVVNPTTGKVNRFVFDRYVQLTAQLSLNQEFKQKVFWVVVEALDITKMTDVQVLENYVSAIARTETQKVRFISYSNNNQSYGYLSFFTTDKLVINEQIAPINDDNRPGIKKTSTNFVVVHDTANNGSTATAKAHANYVSDGGGGTSWHYSVDDKSIYHQIPDDEIAYHAGDGSRLFNLIDTGVKATVKRPNITIDSEGYFLFNGVKSKIQFTDSGDKVLTPSGIYYEIGQNGNYYLNDTYYNSTYGVIANRGGNRNSIGIETCVYNGCDYATTCRNNAKLVAKLLSDNKLTVDAVMQHNNMSGKDCPNAIRGIGYWQNFRDLVSFEKFGLEHFSKLTFSWKSNSEIMTNSGTIASNLNGATSLSYSLVVTDNLGAGVYSNNFETKLK